MEMGNAKENCGMRNADCGIGNGKCEIGEISYSRFNNFWSFAIFPVPNSAFRIPQFPNTMNPKYYIACDLGAESGRVMLGRLEDGRLTLEEMHRFPSAAVRVLGSLRWDVLRIFEELKTGLRQVAGRHVSVASLSVDSWGWITCCSTPCTRC